MSDRDIDVIVTSHIAWAEVDDQLLLIPSEPVIEGNTIRLSFPEGIDVPAGATTVRSIMTWEEW